MIHMLFLQAVERVLAGNVQSALAVVRPPGHHAECSTLQRATVPFCLPLCGLHAGIVNQWPSLLRTFFS